MIQSLSSHQIFLTCSALTGSGGFYLDITQKIITAALINFDLLRQTYFCGVGVNEFFMKGFRPHQRIVKIGEVRKMSGAFTESFSKRSDIQRKEAEDYILRGTFFLASGTFGAIAAIRRQVEEFPRISTRMFGHLGNGFFLAANLLTLEISKKQYDEAREVLMSSQNQATLAAAEKACYSAIMGIISSLNYIVVGGMYILGGSAAVALLLGCVATSTGVFKTLYDWYYVVPQSPSVLMIRSS